MPNLLVMCPNSKDATSFYRGVGPLAALRKQMKGLSLTFCQEYNWSTFALVDAFFAQRPYNKNHLFMIQMAKSAGVPVWLDYDDDLFSVPTDNPAFALYNDEAKKVIIDCVKLADYISVTTPALAEKMRKINGNVVVIPNAFNDILLGERPTIMRQRHPLVLWRGSQTHVRDLMNFSGQIDELFQRFEQWTWNFMGYNPWFITDVFDSRRCLTTEMIDVMEYFSFLGKVQAAVQMVPLHDSPFNRAKSNIAMIEGAFAGSVTVAPAWEEWKAPGVLLYRDTKEFLEIMKLVLSDAKFPFYDNSKQTWTYVMDTLRLSKVNKWRHELLQEMFDKGRPLHKQSFPEFRP